MLREGIEMEAIRSAESGRTPETIGRWDFELRTRGEHHIEIAFGLWEVVEALGCLATQTGQRREARRSCLQVVGPISVLESLKVMLPWLDLQMERAVREKLKEKRREIRYLLDCPGGRREHSKQMTRYRRGLYRGFGKGVAAKIRAQSKKIEDEVKGTGAELVLASRSALVRSEYERQFPKVGKARNYDFARDGYFDGYREGERADLGDHSLSGATGELEQ